MAQQTCLPYRQYHVTLEVETRDFRGRLEVKPLDAEGRLLSYTHLPVQGTQPFTRHDITFNSLDRTAFNLYIGVWGGSGSLAIRGMKLEECGPVQEIQRWLAAVDDGDVEGVRGVMYTTWVQNYDDLESFAATVQAWRENPRRR